MWILGQVRVWIKCRDMQSTGLKREATIVDDLAENNEIMRVAASTIAAMVMLAPQNM